MIKMPKIRVKEGENLEHALRKFKRKCEKLGILSEIKKREFFKKPSIAKKEKSILAKKRLLKKVRRDFY